RFLIDVTRQEICVARLRASVAADVEVVAFFSGDEPEVLRLRFGALADAAADRALQLVRRANALVTVLDANREADRILDSEAAPGRSDAALHGAERFAVGVSALESSRNELFPDVG